MKCIITVLGTYLSSVNVNILDISQTIVSGYFNMMMIVEMSEASKPMEAVSEELSEIGKELGVIITTQHEDIFNCMHRI